MKKILMISTGGTIAMSVDKNVGGAVTDKSINDLVQMVSEVSNIVDIETYDYKNIPSPHLTLDNMLELSKIVNENIERDDIDGILISHGTDTMEETAYFLELTTNSNKPITLVGAMRNNSDLGYDGASNIESGIYATICPESMGKGVLVVMNNRIHLANYVTKCHTTALDTFRSPNYGEIGYVIGSKVTYHRAALERQFINTAKIENKVALIKSFAGIESDYITMLLENGYKGIVIEAFGSGNLNPDLSDSIEYYINEKKVPIVIVSRCLEGSIEPSYAYKGGGKYLQDIGVISGGMQSGQKARIKLSLLLSVTDSLDVIKSSFEDFIA